jgi:hypothetical protein
MRIFWFRCYDTAQSFVAILDYDYITTSGNTRDGYTLKAWNGSKSHS